jgi:hypothetical protein
MMGLLGFVAAALKLYGRSIFSVCLTFKIAVVVTTLPLIAQQQKLLLGFDYCLLATLCFFVQIFFLQ